MKNPFAGLDEYFKKLAAKPEPVTYDFLTAQDVMAGAAQTQWFISAGPVNQPQFRDVLRDSLKECGDAPIAPGVYKSLLTNAVCFVMRENYQSTREVELTIKPLMRNMKQALDKTPPAERAGIVAQFLAIPDYTAAQREEHLTRLELMARHY